MAWLVGVWLKRQGHGAPRGVRMSRGCTLHANGMVVSAADASALVRVR